MLNQEAVFKDSEEQNANLIPGPWIPPQQTRFYKLLHEYCELATFPERSQFYQLLCEYCELATLPEHLGLFKLVQEYCELAILPELSEVEAKRVAELFELAVYDESLDQWIAKVDEVIELVEQIKLRKAQEPLSLEDFILLIKCSREMTLEKFKELVKQLHLSDNLLNEHIFFRNETYCRQLVCEMSRGCVYVVSWKPGQCSQPHPHGDDFSIIRVYKGTLTHRFCKEVNHSGKIGYRPIDERKFRENELICVDRYQYHQLVNQSEENLVTIHFRFFQQPIEMQEFSCNESKTVRTVCTPVGVKSIT